MAATLLLVVFVAGNLLLPLKVLKARDYGVGDRSLHETSKIELVAALKLGLQRDMRICSRAKSVQRDMYSERISADSRNVSFARKRMTSYPPARARAWRTVSPARNVCWPGFATSPFT